ncbi:MAG: biotin synthase BioB [Nitrospiraceae bacterium]|nr:biotin synthase BioB [Nitrospiraceae bacterium]
MKKIIEKISSGSTISAQEALSIAECGPEYADAILCAAEAARMRCSGNTVELCAIVNAKSGLCSENCAYCAQSSISRADIATYPVISVESARQKAAEAVQAGVTRFGIVTSGKKCSKNELITIGKMIEAVRSVGIHPCASLGLLNKEELEYLKSCGLERYHNNLETSENFFPRVCTTHTYKDKIRTIEAALSSGLSVCSGGIFGLGESWQDRIDMALALSDLGVDSVPINFFVPVEGTPLQGSACPGADEALRIISIYKMLLPRQSIRICGGRLHALGSKHHMIFRSGADAVMTGNYLTTTGRTYSDDVDLINAKGLLIKGF